MVLHTLKTLLGCIQKNDAASTMNSCLKDSHTNFQKYIGIGITYFGKFTLLYAKNDAASNKNYDSCLKDSHTNFQINVEIGISYF